MSAPLIEASAIRPQSAHGDVEIGFSEQRASSKVSDALGRSVSDGSHITRRTRSYTSLDPKEMSAMSTTREDATPAAHSPRVPWSQLWRFALATAVALIVGCAPFGFDATQGEAHRCLGILVFVSVCWALEPIPSYITALCVPILVVVCGVMRVPGVDQGALVPANAAAYHDHKTLPGAAMDTTAAAAVMSASFFDPIIMLFISGFTMAAAMDKHHISARVALMLLQRAGNRPSRIVLAIMVLAVLLSMFLSNVAAAVLLSAVVKPVLRTLPEESSWPKTVLLGIAFACNLGGMSSPIASPQNVFAMIMLQRAGKPVTFIQWCLFSLPFVFIGGFFLWLLLRKSFKTNLPEGLQYSFDSADLPALGTVHVFIISVVAVTVLLWSIFDSVQGVFGSMGIVGLIPVILFYGLQLLTLVDFNSMPWSVLILMGGGLALGNAVQSSGLLDILATKIQGMLDGHGLWMTFFVFNLVTGILSNFLSSTVCAVIMLPVIAKIGVALGHPKLLVIGVALMTSGAMGLPVSSFPNANSCSMTNDEGRSILSTMDYVKTGFPTTVMLFTILCSVGYFYMLLLGW